MAKIYEEVIVLKLSKLTKDGTSEPIVNLEIIEALEQVAQQLVGEGVIVEVEKA